jgi:hypothetical protein
MGNTRQADKAIKRGTCRDLALTSLESYWNLTCAEFIEVGYHLYWEVSGSARTVGTREAVEYKLNSNIREE